MSGHYRTRDLLRRLIPSNERFATAAALQDPGPLLELQFARSGADLILAASEPEQGAVFADQLGSDRLDTGRCVPHRALARRP